MSKIITNVGLGILSKRIKGTSSAPLYIGWGTGTSAPVAGNTALQIEDTSPGYSRILGVSTIQTISATDDTYVVSGTITAQASLQITEWGLFDVSGNLVAREVQLPGYTLEAGQGVNFLFKLQTARI